MIIATKDGAELTIKMMMMMISAIIMRIVQMNRLFILVLRRSRMEYFDDATRRERCCLGALPSKYYLNSHHPYSNESTMRGSLLNGNGVSSMILHGKPRKHLRYTSSACILGFGVMQVTAKRRYCVSGAT